MVNPQTSASPAASAEQLELPFDRSESTAAKSSPVKLEKGPPVDPNTGKVVPAGSKAVKPTELSPRMTNILRNMAGIGRAMNVFGNIVGAFTDLQQIFPEQFVREAKKLEINYSDPELPIFARPSGYAVEKVSGQIIYRDPKGKQISKEKAQQELDALRGGVIYY